MIEKGLINETGINLNFYGNHSNFVEDQTLMFT